MQLVAGTRHLHSCELCAVTRGSAIEVQHGKSIVPGRIGIEQRNVRKRLGRRLHRHRRRWVEGLVGKQFRDHVVPPRGVVPRSRESRIDPSAASFENAGVFLKDF
jgi:hypothetical protein